MIFTRQTKSTICRLLCAISLLVIPTFLCAAGQSKDKAPSKAAGSPLPFDQFAPQAKTPPPGATASAQNFTLRVGYALLPERVEGIRGVTQMQVPPDIFREHMVWADVTAPLNYKTNFSEGKYVTQTPQGDNLPRPHNEGKWAYLYPYQLSPDNKTVFCLVYFHHTKVIGWEYFLNLPRGARLEQTSIHEELALPLDQWLIIPGHMIHSNVGTPSEDTHLYYLLRLTEQKSDTPRQNGAKPATPPSS